MRARGLLILALVVAALAAFVWFFERRLPDTAEREARAQRLLSIEAEDVSEVVLQWDGHRVRLEREPADDEEVAGDTLFLPQERGWRMVEPMEWPADRYAVEDMVRALVGLAKLRELGELERGEYGLEPPEATATLVTVDGERQVVELGRRLPAGAGRVVARKGEAELYVVADAIHATLTREPGTWRSSELFPAQRADIESVRLQAAETTVRLTRRDQDLWLEAPFTDLADRELVESLLGAVVGLRAERFVDDPASEGELGLQPPLGVLEVAVRGLEAPLRIEWGAPVPGDGAQGGRAAHYLRLRDQVVVVRAELGEHLRREPRQWRSRRWASIPAYQVERAVVRDQVGTLELERHGADWRRGETTVLYGPVGDLLATLTDVRADRLLTPEQAASAGVVLGEPRLTVNLAPAQGPAQTLELFASTEEGLPARVSGREVVLLLPRSLGVELEDRIRAVRGAEALALFEVEG